MTFIDQLIAAQTRYAQSNTTLPLIGVNIHTGAINTPNPTALQQAQMAANVGAQIVRTSTDWDVVEGSLGVYTFTDWTNLFANMQSSNIKLLIALCYGSHLYMANYLTPPTTGAEITAYKNYVNAVCSQWVPNTNTYYQIWNEPDASVYWGGTVNLGQYSNLVSNTIPVITTINASATIITSLIGFENPDMQSIWANNTWTNLAAFDTHPYPQSEEIPEIILCEANNIRKLTGNSKPVWFSEQGYPESYVTGDTQLAYFAARSVLTAMVAGIGVYCWYDMIDDDGVGVANNPSNYGLYQWSVASGPFTAKPAANAFGTVMNSANSCLTYSVYSPGTHCAAVQFNYASTCNIFAWSYGNTSVGISLSMNGHSVASAIDILNNSVTSTITGNFVNVTLPANGSPIVVSLSS